VIRVVFQTTDAGRPRGLEVNGHAGLSEAGSDIVCAAVSVLAENLVAGLRALLKQAPEVVTGNGRLECRMDTADLSYESDLLFASTMLGLKAVARQYPERVIIVESGPRETA
jgi:uncharacterized protein YsxB (DUF464 family)